jgi:uncharacterized protein YjbJ (UPF0337 family)
MKSTHAKHTKSTEDKVSGTVNGLVGRAKEVVGKATNSARLNAKGRNQRTRGETQKVIGKFKSILKVGLYRAGDFIEVAGRKLKRAGAVKAGRILEKSGDEIENLADKSL